MGGRGQEGGGVGEKLVGGGVQVLGKVGASTMAVICLRGRQM
jgi:hypothetical protein